MRFLFVTAMIFAAFCAGVLAAPFVLGAQAAPSSVTTTALVPEVIDLSAMTDAEIGSPVPHIGTLRTRFLVKTPQATIAIQSGNVPAHVHLGSNEIQYVISGTGSFLLGTKRVIVHPGDLIIIPKGTPHSGNMATSGEFKTLAIKIPPQASGDMHFLN